MQTLDPTTGTYGSCTATSCSPTYVLYQGECVAETRNCTASNGSGTQTFDPATGTYGTCTPTQCDAEYVLYGGQCVARTQSCTVENGTGTRTFDQTTGTYGTCEVTACSAGFADCDDVDSTGCEAGTASSCSNCGSCGNVCAADQVCNAGVCGPPPPPPTFEPQACTTSADCVQNGYPGVCAPTTGRDGTTTLMCVYVTVSVPCPGPPIGE